MTFGHDDMDRMRQKLSTCSNWLFWWWYVKGLGAYFPELSTGFSEMEMLPKNHARMDGGLYHQLFYHKYQMLQVGMLLTCILGCSLSQKLSKQQPLIYIRSVNLNQKFLLWVLFTTFSLHHKPYLFKRYTFKISCRQAINVFLNQYVTWFRSLKLKTIKSFYGNDGQHQLIWFGPKSHLSRCFLFTKLHNLYNTFHKNPTTTFG